MLKIWGRTTSANVQKVMWAVGELALPHERVDLGGPFGGNREPEYLAKNPNGFVPTIEDDGFVLWESNTILRYLAANPAGSAGATLEPADRRDRARASQWMDWELTVASPAFRPVFIGLVRTPAAQRDAAAIAAATETSIAAMTILDAALAGSAYLAGDTFSYGDIPLAVLVRRFLELVVERPSLSNIERWYTAIEARPAFREHVGGIPMV
ncbi:glutathione S-transferase family protein [Rhodoplanes serenus]|uniref:glutathione S-transferase family protein n=1 Tax=Rhodoplanes serenus TaxID=200615 RepID=UPI000DAF344F|nr:glutathione S-transferase N-terminal domain-containing protein [Rhodoplanes serenus]RAI30646.1 glutathione S-transferase [Rhodoplanes serenus]